MENKSQRKYLKKILDRDKNKDLKTNFPKTLFFFDFLTLENKIKINLLAQKLFKHLLLNTENIGIKAL